MRTQRKRKHFFRNKHQTFKRKKHIRKNQKQFMKKIMPKKLKFAELLENYYGDTINKPAETIKRINHAMKELERKNLPVKIRWFESKREISKAYQNYLRFDILDKNNKFMFSLKLSLHGNRLYDLSEKTNNRIHYRIYNKRIQEIQEKDNRITRKYMKNNRIGNNRTRNKNMTRRMNRERSQNENDSTIGYVKVTIRMDRENPFVFIDDSYHRIHKKTINVSNRIVSQLLKSLLLSRQKKL